MMTSVVNTRLAPTWLPVRTTSVFSLCVLLIYLFMIVFMGVQTVVSCSFEVSCGSVVGSCRRCRTVLPDVFTDSVMLTRVVGGVTSLLHSVRVMGMKMTSIMTVIPGVSLNFSYSARTGVSVKIGTARSMTSIGVSVCLMWG